MKNIIKKIKNNKLFFIPCLIWAILCIITFVTNKNTSDQDSLKISDFILSSFIIFVPWYIISCSIKKILKNNKKESTNKIVLNNIYKFKCSINEEDYSNLINCFPLICIRYMIFPILINFIIAFILFVCSKNISFCIFYFSIALILTVYFQLKNIKKNMKKEYKKIKINENNTYIIEFHNDNIVKKYNGNTNILKYTDIKKGIKSENNLYLLTNKNLVYIVQLNNNLIDDHLFNFLNYKINLLNKEEKLFSKNVNIIKMIMLLLFISCIISIFGAVNTYEYFCKEIYPLKYSFLRNLYVFWFWLPIPIITIALGIKFKNIINTKKHINFAKIILLFLSIGGLFSLSHSYEVNYNKINDYKNFIGFNLPTSGKLEYVSWSSWNEKNILEYSTTIAYFTKEDTKKIEYEISNSKNWILKTNLPTNLNIYTDIDVYSSDEVYYSIYNQTLNMYNVIPTEKKDYKIYVLKYVIPDRYLEIKEYLYRN